MLVKTLDGSGIYPSYHPPPTCVSTPLYSVGLIEEVPIMIVKKGFWNFSGNIHCGAPDLK